jgi:hypothetical protein
MRAPVLKITVGFLLLFLANHLFGQSQSARFNQIDWAVETIDAATPEALAQQLTAPYTTDLEKVRSIFRWITAHVAYAVPQRTSVRRSALRYNPMDSALALKSVDEIVAYTVLQKRTAVCNGYARLFKTLCDYSGIRAELVTGYARVNYGNAKFRSNHTWNAVYVDSAWHLLDATWASGFITFGDAFVKHYDDSYFFPDPEQFIHTHYPEDLKWSLLSHPPVLREFNETPFRLTAFAKYGINSYAPAKGVIEAAVGDTLQFRLELKGKTTFNMAPEPEAVSMLLSGAPTSDFVEPVVISNEVLYTYVIPSDAVEWVHLVFNKDVVLRYRLQIRKPISASEISRANWQSRNE